MLPDLPNIKAGVFPGYPEVIRAGGEGFPDVPFADCQVHPCFEGSRYSILRATGDGEVRDFDRIEAAIEIKIDDDLDAVFGKLSKMALEMAEKMIEQSFKTLNAIMEAQGRVLDGKGKTWTEQFLEMLEQSIHIPLKPDGTLDFEGVRVVGEGPDRQKAEREMQELEVNPAQKRALYERLNTELKKWRKLMLSKLIESWLDNASEKSYQPAFCQMLMSQGYTVIYSTRHCNIEYGKDVLAIANDGVPCAFQLKGNPGGGLSLNQFNAGIRQQAGMLLDQHIDHPSISKDIPHRSYLVTNGRIEEEVSLAISQINATNVRDGYPKRQLQTIAREQLLTWAIELESSLWPSELSEMRVLLEIYL